MGSLPNLNELCGERAERRQQERERDLARERQRERDFSRQTDKMDKTIGGGAGATTERGLPIFIHQTQIPRHQHQRHSLTTRKVHRTRSSGATHHIWDDPMIEHMAAYSPISSRGHRTNITAPPYQIQLAAAACRRRDSVNSSIGATSVRRLLTVNRGCRNKVPAHIRSKVVKNFTFLVIAHGLACAVLVPLFGIQGSNSTWYYKDKWFHLGPNIGSILLSLCCLLTSGMCMLTTAIIRKIGYIALIAISYGGLCLFLMAHIYPTIYILLPGYLVLGAVLGPALISKWNLVVFFANRISCGQRECGTSNCVTDTYDDKSNCNRDERVRRLARWFHAAENLGIVIGAILASVVMTWGTTGREYHNSITIKDSTTTSAAMAATFETGNQTNSILNTSLSNNISSIASILMSTIHAALTTLPSATPNVTIRKGMQSIMMQQQSSLSPASPINHSFEQLPPLNSSIRYEFYNGEPTQSQSDQFIDIMFTTNEQGARVCGSDLCPVWIYTSESNYTIGNRGNVDGVGSSDGGAIILIIVYIMFGLIGLTLTCFSQKIDNSFKCEQFRGITDTLLFAGPMSYFVGTEQAYVLVDFQKAFVSCSLGPQSIAGALIGMGLMQLVVSCTLSMLLRHTKRYAVLAAGFFFHACLLLVLSRWKPSSDDSALFFVIAAAWGACNAMWETLIFALITLTHATHLMEIASPLQALRFLGLGITFAAHGFLCENPKILILVILLVLTVLPYGMLEVRLETQRKNQMASL